MRTFSPLPLTGEGWRASIRGAFADFLSPRPSPAKRERGNRTHMQVVDGDRHASMNADANPETEMYARLLVRKVRRPEMHRRIRENRQREIVLVDRQRPRSRDLPALRGDTPGRKS